MILEGKTAIATRGARGIGKGVTAAELIGTGYPAHRPEDTAATVAWLASHPDAVRFAGSDMINAPEFFTINGIDRPDGNPT